MKQTTLLFVVAWMSCVLLLSTTDGDSLDEPRIGGPCNYVEIPGTATITALRNPSPDDYNCRNAVDIRFSFVPDDLNARDNYLYPNWSDSDQHFIVGSGMNPPRNWALQSGLVEGSTHRCVRQEMTSGTCTPVIFTFPEISYAGWADECFTQGDTPVPVTLALLTATTTTQSITLKWRTATESDNVGFNIYRRDNNNGNYIKVNNWLIPVIDSDATQHDYWFTDEEVVLGKTYYYYLETVALAGKKGTSPILKITVGQESEVKVIDQPNITLRQKFKSVLIPTEFALLQNFPNPFNPDTWIPFKIAQDTPVTISIYDTSGQLIRTISLGNKNAGIYTTKGKAVYWDGTDNLGQKVSSGVYYYTLRAGEFRATRKMVVVK